MKRYLYRKTGRIYRNVDIIKNDIEKVMARGIRRILLSTVLFEDKDYQQEFLEKIKYPDFQFMVGCPTPETRFYDFVVKLQNNFRSDTTLFFESLDFLDKPGSGPETKDVHRWLKDLKFRKLVSLNIVVPSVDTNDINAFVDLVFRYKDDPSVSFITGELFANTYVNTTFSEYVELSKNLQFRDFIGEQQVRNLDMFYKNIKKKKLQHKLKPAAWMTPGERVKFVFSDMIWKTRNLLS